MRLGTMTAIVVLLVSVTGGSKGSGLSELETALSSQTSRADRPHRHRHGHNNLRHSMRRRRPDASAGPAAPLRLPADLQESAERVELEHGLRRYTEPSGDYSVCCPAVEERTSPKAGRLRDGRLAFLHARDDFQQVFFEHSCDTKNKQPRGVGHLSRRRFRCVQEYSYTYAVVLDDKGGNVLDWIRIRSGCRCEVKHRGSRRKKKRKRDRKKRAEIRRKRRRQRGGQSQTNARNAS